MALMGIDAGTTGCKTALFSEKGELISLSYVEYDFNTPEPGYAELDSHTVWERIKKTIKEALFRSSDKNVQSIAVSSFGEAVVPVSRNREILGPSILAFDRRGEEFLNNLPAFSDDSSLHRINGNTFGNHYGLTKILWIKKYRPELYEKTDTFLLWGGFIPFMLGADPFTDFSLANRTLLFDINKEDWSEELLSAGGIDREKLPAPIPSGTRAGEVSKAVADELGLPPHTPIIAGTHDQCANAVGCGVISENQAMIGLGTYTTIVPVFRTPQNPEKMRQLGLNIEHHAVPDKFVSFIYNLGGSIVKWYRDTFAKEEHARALKEGQDVYKDLFNEIPEKSSRTLVLPHFSMTGPPEYISDSCGIITGLYLDTARGEILKAIVEGALFGLKECVDALPDTGIEIASYRAVGGGSKSDTWVQLCADLFGKEFIRPKVTEAGALGVAIIAGTGKGVFSSLSEGIETMVQEEKRFEPQPDRNQQYQNLFEKYKKIWPLMKNYLREIAQLR